MCVSCKVFGHKHTFCLLYAMLMQKELYYDYQIVCFLYNVPLFCIWKNQILYNISKLITYNLFQWYLATSIHFDINTFSNYRLHISFLSDQSAISFNAYNILFDSGSVKWQSVQTLNIKLYFIYALNSLYTRYIHLCIRLYFSFNMQILCF